ncbi:MAG: c-type cytochrome [Candidatus Acidiferrum sp.]
MNRSPLLAAAFAVLISSTVLAIAQDRKDTARAPGDARSSHDQQAVAAADPTTSTSAPAPHASNASHRPAKIAVLDERAARIEGEKRFHTNCGRCHVAPQKFPPRAMATIVRHMRVRAMLTDEDMRLILRYMTQ